VGRCEYARRQRRYLVDCWAWTSASLANRKAFSHAVFSLTTRSDISRSPIVLSFVYRVRARSRDTLKMVVSLGYETTAPHLAALSLD
jgi:hypothetical protein